MISFDFRGYFSAAPLSNASEFSAANYSDCPDTHFMCPGNGNCLPVYTRCNGVYDCPGMHDERSCPSYICPGFYRCRDSSVCVHSDNVCDGIYHCPQHDDEICSFSCPLNCTCYRHAFICNNHFLPNIYPELRYADASSTSMVFENFSWNKLLISLSLRHCNITSFVWIDLPNLRYLDLSHNLLTFFPVLISKLQNLRYLSIAFNKLTYLNDEIETFDYIPLISLNMAGLMVTELNTEILTIFRDLHTLNLSSSKLQVLPDSGFSPLPDLRVLDLQDCEIDEIKPGIFRGLKKLCTIYVNNYKLCCPSVLPGNFDPQFCHAPSDEVSSCDALLRADVFRIFLAVYALLALMGNAASFIYRVFVKGLETRVGFDVFITNLCVSDFCMGICLAIIGVADRMFYGTYEWEDAIWKHSVACKVAGFLSFMSSEVSVFLICLITMERFLVYFPHKQFRFNWKSAQFISTIAWILGILLAAISLLPEWDIYNQTGICIPPLITRGMFPGSRYVFGVMICLNFVLFILVALGQFSIFYYIRASSKAVSHCTQNSREVAVAKRLLAVVMTDFLCWFPIGLLGLLARGNVPVSDEINVSMAIFVLPFNSALNPFLYNFLTFNEQQRNEM